MREATCHTFEDRVHDQGRATIGAPEVEHSVLGAGNLGLCVTGSFAPTITMLIRTHNREEIIEAADFGDGHGDQDAVGRGDVWWKRSLRVLSVSAKGAVKCTCWGWSHADQRFYMRSTLACERSNA